MVIRLSKTATYRDYLKSKGASVIAEKTYYKYLETGNVRLRQYSPLLKDAIKYVEEHTADQRNTKAKDLRNKLQALLLTIKRGLAQDSKTETSDQWRKSRKSIEVRLRAAGYPVLAERVNKIQNPTPYGRRATKPKRTQRIMRVTPQDLKTILDDRADAGDDFARSVITLGWYIGMRPSEISGIKIKKMEGKTLTLWIPSAKKLEAPGIERGLDREIVVDLIDARRFAAFGWALVTAQRHLKEHALRHYADKNDLDWRELSDEQIEDAQSLYTKALQQRLNRMSKRLFPRRTTHFCLYSLRYNMGSQLKYMYRNNLGEDEAARFVSAVLGHRNIASSNCYGNYSSGRSAVVPVPTKATRERVIDNRHGKNSIKNRLARQAANDSPGF